jgi:cytochrome P450
VAVGRARVGRALRALPELRQGRYAGGERVGEEFVAHVLGVDGLLEGEPVAEGEDHHRDVVGGAWVDGRPGLDRAFDDHLLDGYLDAVVKEILRVRPVIFDVARVLKAPIEIRGWTLPAGVTVMPSTGLVHLDADRYEDPLQFKPERFLERQSSSYSWIPFGGGIRRCLGAAFAMFEMKVILRTVFSQIELRAPDARPERAVGRHITLIPSDGTRVMLERRVRPTATRTHADL